MRITIQQLSALFWVVRLGSVHAAADQLNLAQPTVSLRLRDLEAAVGRPLFERTGRGLRPTPDGRLVFARAATILTEVERIQELGAGGSDVRGIVRIGMQETFALASLAPLIRLLSERHPNLRPELAVQTSGDLERAVHDRTLDLAFVSNPLGGPRVKIIPLGVQEGAWAAPADWILPELVRPGDLHTLPILCTPHPSPMHRLVLGWFHSAGLEPLRLDLCSSGTVIAQLVTAGVAAAFLPRRMIEPAARTGVVRLLTTRPVVNGSHVAAIYAVDVTSPTIGAVLRCAQDVLARISFLRQSDTKMLPSTDDPAHA